MKERPILFSGPMVRAILEGRKTQTRRLVKPQPVPFGKSSYGGTRQGWKWKPESLNRSWNDDDSDPYNRNKSAMATYALAVESPYGQPGDRLWVRETWSEGLTYAGEYQCVFFKADGVGHIGSAKHPVADVIAGKFGIADGRPMATAPKGVRWRPSIHMPRWASRLTLEITGIRVERLQEITEEDSEKEGMRRVVMLDRGAIGSIDCERDEKQASFRNEFQFTWECCYGLDSWDANPWVWAVEFRKLEDSR